MISLCIKDRTWSNYQTTLYRDRGDGANGYSGLTISHSDPGGFETIKFQIPLCAPYESNNIMPFYAVDAWHNRIRVWQGRVVRPIQENTNGSMDVECEGVGIALGRSDIASYTYASETPHQVFNDYIQVGGFADINLLNTDTSQIATAGNSYLISSRTYQEAQFSQVFNEAANFGFDDFQSGSWGVDSGRLTNAQYISDMGNRFFWRKRDMTVVDAVIPYAWLEDCQITLDTDKYCNQVRVRYGSAANNYVDVGDGVVRGGNASANQTAIASQSKYTPGHRHWAGVNAQSNSNQSPASLADATQLGNVYIARYSNPWPKGQIILGEKFLAYNGGLASLLSVIAGMNVQIPGLTMAHPELLGTVTDQTVFRVNHSLYDDEAYTQTLTLNDFPDNSAVMQARLTGNAA